ncbi:hypothetical protein [Streptomyces brevispora]|uniref:hypothetical protein n=1 Tax=Streptomyces brevispora TaxID=887462 RepID=UPI0035DC9566
MFSVCGMKKWFAQFGSSDKEHEGSVYDVHPDLAEAFIDAIRNQVNVQGPRHAGSFDDLTSTIAQTSRTIQHLEAFRELAIAAADRTNPHADRKAIAIAAGFPPSRLYRVLEKHGRPADRKQGATQVQALEQSVRALGGLWDPQRAVTVLADVNHQVDEKRTRQILRDLAEAGLLTKIQDRPVQYRAIDE